MNQDILDRRVTTLNLLSRAHNALMYAKVHYIGQLVNMTPEQLIEIESLGVYSLENITAELDKLGLRLSMNIDYTPKKQHGEKWDCEDHRANLKGRRLEYYNAIMNKPGINSQQLAEMHGVHIGTMRNHIKDMCRHGLLECIGNGYKVKE